MSPQELLDIEVAVLLIRHGQKSVINAIARRLSIDDDHLQNEVHQLAHASVKQEKKKAATAPFMISVLIAKNPEKSELLGRLHDAYLNRVFLPELKDVKRLFERHGKSSASLKSRTLAEGPVFRFLATLDSTSLEKIKSALHSGGSGNDFSSLGVISDEILRRDRHT